jgi:Cft2 family RNA processing exonuclease
MKVNDSQGLNDAMEELTTLTQDDHMAWQHKSKYSEDDQAIIDRNSLMHNVKDEIYFTEKFPVRMQLKQLNVVNLDQIDAIFVSTFQEVYGLPFLLRNGDFFKAKIYITQAMAQIAKPLLIEFVRMCAQRNRGAIQYCSNPDLT